MTSIAALTLRWDDISKEEREALNRAIALGYTTARLVGDLSSKDKSRIRIFVQIRVNKKPETIDCVELGEIEEEEWIFVDDVTAIWNKVNT